MGVGGTRRAEGENRGLIWLLRAKWLCLLSIISVIRRVRQEKRAKPSRVTSSQSGYPATRAGASRSNVVARYQ